MPIVAKHVIDARRAAAALREAKDTRPPSTTSTSSVPVRQADPSDPVTPLKSAAPKQRRGHATKDVNGKSQPTGDYSVGWCRPPEQTQFRKGCKPGPGRPKGSLSHDTLLKRQLDQKQLVRINGREKNLSLRELIVTRAVMAAVEGKDRDARKYVLAESARLYATLDNTADVGADGRDLNASDALTMQEFMDDLREQVRAELLLERSTKTTNEL